jgi:tetratricopeptide (TPR) repeat protein
MAIVQSQFDAANAYLKRITLPEKALDVQFHAALILAHQGNMTAARQLIQSVTASTPELVIQTQLAEARLLRQFDRDKEALQVLQECNQKFPDTPEVLYEMAMTQDGLGQYESMEKNLRTLIGLRPNHAHAHNALGYSLADRGIRLNEALELVERALELMPNEPFITDSLGWVHFKMGHTATAIDVLRKAYAYRPDVEIATHLAEVLWVQGQTQEAIELWQQAQQLDKTNTTLLKTLKRLGVSW